MIVCNWSVVSWITSIIHHRPIVFCANWVMHRYGILSIISDLIIHALVDTDNRSPLITTAMWPKLQLVLIYQQSNETWLGGSITSSDALIIQCTITLKSHVLDWVSILSNIHQSIINDKYINWAMMYLYALAATRSCPSLNLHKQL